MLTPTPSTKGRSQVQLHANAKLTPESRLLLVRRVLKQQWPVVKAARAAAVSRQTAHKWLNRFKEGGRVLTPAEIAVETTNPIVPAP